MGAWDYDTFDNDTACDWAYALEKSDDLSVIKHTLNEVIENDNDYLDSDVASEGLAACDTLARLRGTFGVRNSYTEAVDNWVAGHPDLDAAPLLPLAHRVIDRILGEDSELVELWEDSGAYDKWRAKVDSLRSRLE